MTPAVRALAAGAVAHAAVIAAGGRARVLAQPGGSLYLTAGADIVWLGPPAAPLHVRALHAADVVAAALEAEVRIDVGGLLPWRPAPLTLDGAAVTRLRDALRDLAANAGALGAPAGFGPLLIGAPLSFPLDGATKAARELARACAGDDVGAARQAAQALLGLGAGLTPSGDDFVGGALFARHLLAAAGLADGPAWRDAADALVDAARERTHPISAALLADLAAGAGHAPLHDLVAALARGDAAQGLQSAARLVRLGHSSGWDILAGFAAGVERA